MLFFRSRLFLKWVGVYALLLAVPTLVTGIVSYRVSRRVLVDQAEAASREAVRSAGRQCDGLFRDVNTLTVLLEYLPWLTRIVDLSEDDALRGDRYGPNDILRIITFLRTCRVRYPLIAEIAVFIRNADMVIDCEGKYGTEEYFGTRYSLYSPETGALNHVDWSDTSPLFVPDATARKYNSALTERILVGRKLARGSAIPRAAVIFMLDKDYLAQTLERFRGPATSALVAVTADGRVVQAVGGPDPALLEPILARSPAGSGQVLFHRRSYAFVWAEAGSDEVRYVAVTAVADLLREVERVRALAYALTAGLLLLGIVLAYATTRRNYLPIRALAERFRSGTDAETSLRDELAVIATTLTKLSTERKSLQRRLSEFMPVVRANMLGRLLAGKEDGVAASDLESCGIRFPGRRVAVAIVVVAPHREPEELGELGRVGASTLVGAAIERHFATAGGICYVVEQDPFEYRVVLSTNAESAAALKPSLERLVEELTNLRGAALTTTVLAAMGDLHTPPGGVALAYAQAQRALDCHFAMPDAEVILYGELSEGIRDEFAFDTQSRRELVRLLRSGDHAKLDAFIDELLAHPIMAHRMGARGAYALLELLLHAIRDTEGMDPHLAQSVNFNELAALSDDGERIRFCRAMYARIAEAVSGRKGGRSDVIVEIVDFVDLNYHDPAMCLTFLSDRFNLSPIYISRLFKQKTGGNFLDYLNRKRVERAKQLLSDPRALIKRVSGAAGFSSDVSFRRVFHKYVAMSPGEFRREALRAASRPASVRSQG